MVQAVTLMRWDDPGAPQIANQTPSELINVLKKCLVEGYGDVDGLGWSVMFEDAANYKIVFRNNADAGTGSYLHVASSDGTDANNKPINLRAAAGMTDIDTFFNASYAYTITMSTVPVQWYLIGTSTGFYFHMIYYNTNHLAQLVYGNKVEPMFFAGDICSFYENDASRFTIVGSNSGGAVTLAGLVASSVLCGLHDTDGVTAPTLRTYFNPSIHRVDTNSAYTTTPAIVGVPHKLSPITLYADISGTDRNGLSTRQSSLSPWLRGKLPGMFFSTFSGYSNFEWPVIENFNGENYLLVRSSNALHHWINITSWPT